jgi:predicted DNA-binding transcriptional regulator YafY
MKHTHRQTTTATLTDLYRALDRQQPVTVTYLKEETREVFAVNSKGVTVRRTIRTGRMIETIRTIEIYDIRTTKTGDVIVKAMDRASKESRTFRVDRIKAYTRHTGATYQIERPTDTTPAFIPTTVEQFITYELDRDDQPTTRARTTLAA